MLLCGGRGPLPRVDLFDQLVSRQPRASDSSSSQSCVLQATSDPQLQPPSFAKRVLTLWTLRAQLVLAPWQLLVYWSASN